MRKRAAVCALFALWAALLLPLFVGALCAHPATDDYVFASITHRTWQLTHSLPHVLKDAVSYALRTWRDWQGTLSGILVMTLSPAVFSLSLYPLHAAALLLLWLTSLFFVTRRLCTRYLGLSRAEGNAAFYVLSLLQLLFWPGYVEGIYWFNGAWFYTFTQALSGFALLLADDLRADGRLGAGRTALLALLLAFIGLNNYITALYTLAALFLLGAKAVFDAPSGSRRAPALRFALLLALPALLLLCSIAAPGNSVRLASDGWFQEESFWFARSLWRTLTAALSYFWRFLTRTPLLALLLALTPALYRRMARAKGRFRAPLAVAAVSLLLLCAMIFPHMYTSGYAGPARIVNLYHAYTLCAIPFVYAYALGTLARRRTGRTPVRADGKKRAAAFALAGALALCLTAGNFQGSYPEAVREVLSGDAFRYRAQVQRQYDALLAAGPGDDVTVPAVTMESQFAMGTLSPAPDDWKNVGMASYFGVKSVRPADEKLFETP